MAHIEKFIAHTGSNYIDNSLTINASQTNTQNNTKVDVQPSVTAANNAANHVSKKEIRLAKKKGNKTDLFRVIMGLYQSGFFKSSDGSPATTEQVFSAFGEMLGDDFSDYANFILAGSKHNNDSSASTRVFETIQDSFIDYETDLINNRDMEK